MISPRGKRTSVLLRDAQIDFLSNLARRLEKEAHKKMSRCRIMEVLTKTLTCTKPHIGKCKSVEEIERELLQCLKKVAKKLEK